MKMNHAKDVLIAVLALSLILNIFAGCSTVEIVQVAVQPPSSYKLSEKILGLTVSVDPYIEEDRLLRYFGTDLLSQGILPVLVVAENHSTDQVFLLEKRKAQLLLNESVTSGENGNSSFSVSGNDVTSDTLNKGLREGSNTILAGAGALLLTPFIAGGPLAFVGAALGEKKWADATIISQNMIKRELMDKTIHPSESHNGFLYFQVKHKQILQGIKGINLSFKDIRTDEVLTFTFHIKKKEESGNAIQQSIR